MQKASEFFDHAKDNNWYVLHDKTPFHPITGGNQMQQARKQRAVRNSSTQSKASGPEDGSTEPIVNKGMEG